MLAKKYLPWCYLLLIFLTACSNPGQQSVSNLRCEFVSDPLGIDVSAPRLSWEIQSKERGVIQTAYRVLVASSSEKLENDEGDLWDSKKIFSDSSVNVIYRGKPLESRTDCYWKVEVWTNLSNKSIQSTAKGGKTAYWSMGLIHPSDWKASWVGLDTFSVRDSPSAVHSRLSARYFRKKFETEKEVTGATVYISGLGLYELYINGQAIGNQVLAPGPTDYHKRVFYNTFDVTDKIKDGENTIGTVLGNGRFFTMRGDHSPIPPITNFGYPKMLLQLEIKYKDGSSQVVVSDGSWAVTDAGPILSNNEFDGEDYDANKEMTGWSRNGFDDHQWKPVEIVHSPSQNVVAQMNPMVRIMDSVKPVSVREIKKGVYIFDLGQNMVGWAHLSIADGRKGDTVTMRFAERLNSDSSLYVANLRSAEAADHYIMREGQQQWEPHFTYHGFRYVEVTGFPGKPDLSSITGKVVYDDMETTGHFETSSPVINQVYKNAYWGIRGNYRGMPTDCPQRDERMGWLGDRAVGSYGESFIFDNNPLYSKWLQDIEDAQRENGSVPDVAPAYWEMYSDNMTWPAAYIITANTLYQQFGNIDPIRKHYASMKKWLYYMRDNYMKDYIMTKDTYGDWCMPPEDPKMIHSQDPARQTAGDYLGTAFYYRMLQLVHHFAQLTGNQKDEVEWHDFSEKVKEAFNKKFLNTDDFYYANNTATANIFALAYHLAPDSIRERVFSHIVDKTLNDFHGHISTGLVGAQWLMRTLSNNGRADIAYQLATNTTYPSWGYMAAEGATTIWELWNGNTADPAMNSGNHVMLLGDLLVWYYENLAGIKSDSLQTGFKKIIMKPIPVKGLDYVRSSYHSVHGIIESNWKKNQNTFEWDITIPVNTSAEISIPAQDVHDITESEKDITLAKGVRLIRMEKGRAVLLIGSGEYHFISKNYEK
jgi:alpha-L-rhamnosidase